MLKQIQIFIIVNESWSPPSQWLCGDNSSNQLIIFNTSIKLILIACSQMATPKSNASCDNRTVEKG